MLLVQERIDYLLGWLDEADYCHLGKWGGSESIDVQQDLEDALNDIASLQSERDALVLENNWMRNWLERLYVCDDWGRRDDGNYGPCGKCDACIAHNYDWRYKWVMEATRKEIECTSD